MSYLATKPGGSTLNPNATAYVPLSKRESYHEQPYVSAQRMDHFASPQMSVPKKSSDMAYTHMKDQDLDMDMEMEYLLVTFSGLSHESINDVYLANNGDLDATVEMLTQLEIYCSEAAQEYLPDTLDIGDVPETIEPTTTTASNKVNASNATPSPSPSLTNVI